MNYQHAAESVVKALADFLKSNMPSVVQATDQFPDANTELRFPSVSVIIRNETYRHEMPYVKSKSEAVDHKSNVIKVLGTGEMSLQVDLWADYKKRLDILKTELWNAFNLNMDVPGVKIQLTSYYDELVSYSLQSDVIPTNEEESSQRGEHRAGFIVFADFRLLKEFVAPIIETIENNLETPTSIEAPPEEDGDLII